MNAAPDTIKISDILALRRQQMLFANPEYQRGAVWTVAQKKKLIDSVLRGYPLPLIYLHLIRQEAGSLVSERYEIIDGQQRIMALFEFHEGAYSLFDPVADQHLARFPDFIKNSPCPWSRRKFEDLSEELKARLMDTQLPIVRVQTHDPNEARDLFVRLQAGMPLNSQEKRDAWPGGFTDFVLSLAGKSGVARYPGHDFFNVLMNASRSQDRGKFRQLAAQIAMLYFSRRRDPGGMLCDINAKSIDDFYYENLGFDRHSFDAERLIRIVNKLTQLLADQKRNKILGHEAIHLVLLVDSLLDDYTGSWEGALAPAFDQFRLNLLKAKLTQDRAQPGEHWLRYGVLTRFNSDRGEIIQRRHEFFRVKMYEAMRPTLKDSTRLYGALERELIYFRNRKQCAVCGSDIHWDELEIHHVEEHAKGGSTTLENGAPVHRQCHPKGAAEVAAFASNWRSRSTLSPLADTSISELTDLDNGEE